MAQPDSTEARPGSRRQRRMSILRAAPCLLLWALRSAAAPLAPPARSASTFFEWDAPAGCADSAALYQRLADAVGYPPERGRFQRVRGVVRREAATWALTLELFEADARRSRAITAEN